MFPACREGWSYFECKLLLGRNEISALRSRNWSQTMWIQIPAALLVMWPLTQPQFSDI